MFISFVIGALQIRCDDHDDDGVLVLSWAAASLNSTPHFSVVTFIEAFVSFRKMKLTKPEDYKLSSYVYYKPDA